MSFLKSKPIVFEGELAEQYKRTRRKWLRLFIVGTVLPFLLPLIAGSVNDSIKLMELVGDGEIILTSFTVTLSLVFDIYSIKEQRKDDENLDNAFAFAICLLAVQLVVYSAVKTSDVVSKASRSLLWSIGLTLSTYKLCTFSVEAMFAYSIIKEEGGDNE